MRLILKLSSLTTRFWPAFMMLVFGALCFLVGWTVSDYRIHPINNPAVMRVFNPEVAPPIHKTSHKERGPK